jgi:CheY-like chemotaxis protein
VTREPRAVLVLGRDPGVRGLLELGLPRHLLASNVVAVADATEALEFLAANPVDVLVIDLTSPALDDLQLLAAARAQHRGLPVVALSGAEADGDERTSVFEGRVCVVHKPATVHEIAAAVLDAYGQPIRGHMRDVELAPLLRLLNVERTSCTLRLRSGARRGQLDLFGGEIVDACSDALAVAGEAAAMELLTWERVNVDFERSVERGVRRIEMPLEALLIDAARRHDEARHAARQRPSSDGRANTEPGDGGASTEPLGGGAGTEPFGGPRIEPGDDATGAYLDAALSTLRTALTGLRLQLDSTGRVLEAAAPWFERLDDSMRGGVRIPGCPDEAQLAESWRELVTVTERLARAAEALAAPSADATP